MAGPTTATLLLKVQVVGNGPQKLTAALHQLGSSQVTRGLNAQTTALSRLNRTASMTSGVFGRGGGLLANMANFSLVAGGVVRGVRMVGGALSSALGPLMDFQKSLAQIQAKGGFAPGQMRELSDSFKDIGRTTMFAPGQAAEGAVALAASGLRPHEIKQQLPKVLNFAQAHDLDTETASDMLVNVSKQLGMRTENFEALSDMMTKAANMSTINVRELAHTMTYVGPLAREASIPPEQLFAMISGLGNLGIKGSKAGTGIRNLLIALSKKPRRGKTSQSILKSFGMTQKDLQEGFGGKYDSEYEGLQGIHSLMAKMNDQMNKHKISNVKRVEALSVLFGAYGMTAAAGGMRFSADEGQNGLQAFARELLNAERETQKAADLMGDTLPGKLRRLDASWQTLKITMAEKYAPVLSDVMDATRRLVLETEKGATEEGPFARLGKQLSILTKFSAPATEETERYRKEMAELLTVVDGVASGLELVNLGLGTYTGFTGNRPVSAEDDAYADAKLMELAIGKAPAKKNLFEPISKQDIEERRAYEQRKAKYLADKAAEEQAAFERRVSPAPWMPGDMSPTAPAPGWAPGDMSPEGKTKGMVELLIGFDQNNLPKVSVKNLKASDVFDLSVGQTNNL